MRGAGAGAVVLFSALRMNFLKKMDNFRFSKLADQLSKSVSQFALIYESTLLWYLIAECETLVCV